MAMDGHGHGCATFLGNPRAKRTTVLPARVFAIAPGSSGSVGGDAGGWRAGCLAAWPAGLDH